MSASDARRRKADQPEEDPVLLANKGALFGNRRKAEASPSGSSAERKESATEKKSSLRDEDAESKAALQSLAEELHGSGGDDGPNELDDLLRSEGGLDDDGVVGGGPSGRELDLTTSEIDFDGVDTDLARFQADPLVMEALRAGVDLRAYSANIDKELERLEQLCVEDYVALARPNPDLKDAQGKEGADSLSALHGQLANCDGILAQMESMLTHFQSDLSSICGEIQSLQEKSYGMGVKLRNYKAAEKALHAFVSRAYIDDSVANAILLTTAHGSGAASGASSVSSLGAVDPKAQPLDERFVLALQDLDQKLSFLTEQAAQALREEAAQGHASHSRRGSRSGSPALAAPPASMPPAAKDMAPLAEKLRLHAVARARAFLLERFHSLRTPKTNIQIKQQSLLKFAPLYQFLLHHADERGNSAGTGGGVAGGALSALTPRGGAASSLSVPVTPSSSGLPPLSPSSSSGADICAEVRRSYHETLSKIYESKFERYLKEIAKLAAENNVRARDTLGSDEGGAAGGGGAAAAAEGGGGMFSSLWGGRKADAHAVDPFRLGNRDEVLTAGGGGSADGSGGAGAAGEGDLIVPHLASSSGAKLPFERLFKSATALLMDTATSEYDFIVEFFGERMQRDMDRAGMHEDALAAEKEAQSTATTPGSTTSKGSAGSGSSSGGYPHVEERGRSGLLPLSRDKDLFKLVFRPTEALFLKHLEKYLSGCHDALSVLLLIRVLCAHNIAMQYRRVHCLDALFDRMNMTLWPKFKQIFDANVRSVQELDANARDGHHPAKEGGRKAHPLATRYADYASGILRLNRGYDDAILSSNLARLSREVNEFLKRSAALAPTTRMQLVYLLNCYKTIMSVLAAGGSVRPGASASATTVSHADSDEYRFWHAASEDQIAEYVKLELQEKFGGVIQTIVAAEKARAGLGGAYASSAPSSSASLPAEVRESVANAVQEFKLKWSKGVIADLHKRIHESFGYDNAAAAGGAAGGAAAAAGKAGGAKGGAPTASAGASGSPESSLARQVFMKVVAELMMYNSRLEELSKKAELKQAANLPTPTHFRMEILPFKQCCPI